MYNDGDLENLTRCVQLAKKMTSVRFLVRFCKKKLWFSVRFRFYNVNCGFLFSVRLGLHSSAVVDAIFHLCLCGMTLEMMYFHAELAKVTQN